MHDGFVSATLVLGLMPAVVVTVAVLWYRRTIRKAGEPPPP